MDQNKLHNLAAYLAGLRQHADIIVPFDLDEQGQRLWLAGYHKAMDDALAKVMALAK